LSDNVISKNKINELLKAAKGKYRVIAPVEEGKNLVFSEVSDTSKIVLDDKITYKSPKEFFFPQTEKLMTFDKDGNVTENANAVKTVIFGMRPCDLEALKVMTAVFTEGKFVDTYFKNHLDNTVTIGVGCLAEKPGCFCAERGIDKGFSKACDIFLNEEGDNYKILHISTKGIEFLKELGHVEFEAGEKMAEESAAQTGTDNLSKIEPESDIKLLEIDADEKTLFEKPDWERISEKCLGCGTCTFICPTCHCFDFKDCVENGENVRYRCWDSCMYPKFTYHASGHNPRSSKKERFRQRVLHKYVYVKKNFGYIACTGCGRCIRSCPAGMNIKEAVKTVIKEIKVDG
jgi:sulfhydrogenase subunit beta (sulfur reductase)